MAPKSANKEKETKRDTPAKKSGGAAAKESPAMGSPAAAAKASAGQARTASPTKEKTPAKKTKLAEEAEVAAAAAEGPAAHTRTKEGDLPATAAGKASAALAAKNGLPAITISDILLGDHRDTIALLKHFEEVSAGGDKLMMEKLTDAIAITIRLHSQAEMDVLYPLIQKRMGGEGSELAKHFSGEHAKIEMDLLKALEYRKSGSKELAGTVKEVLTAFLEHMKEEEDDALPKMLGQMTDEEQIDIALSFQAAKAKAPLEPQPEAAEAMAGGGS